MAHILAGILLLGGLASKATAFDGAGSPGEEQQLTQMIDQLRQEQARTADYPPNFRRALTRLGFYAENDNRLWHHFDDVEFSLKVDYREGAGGVEAELRVIVARADRPYGVYGHDGVVGTALILPSRRGVDGRYIEAGELQERWVESTRFPGSELIAYLSEDAPNRPIDMVRFLDRKHPVSHWLRKVRDNEAADRAAFPKVEAGLLARGFVYDKGAFRLEFPYQQGVIEVKPDTWRNDGARKVWVSLALPAEFQLRALALYESVPRFYSETRELAELDELIERLRPMYWTAR